MREIEIARMIVDVVHLLSLVPSLLLLSGLFGSLSGGNPSPSDHVQKSFDLVNQGDLNAAEKEARLALNIPSSRALAWAVLGAIRLKQSQYEESARFLN